MVKDNHSPSRTGNIKRLVQSGRYRVDPVAVADAMIRRGWTLQDGRERPDRRRSSVGPSDDDGAA